MDDNGNVPEDFEQQMKLALQNLKKSLAEAGATLRNITNVTIYVAEYTPELPIWGVVLEFLTDGEGVYMPPAAMIPVPCLAVPGWKVEIVATAAVSI